MLTDIMDSIIEKARKILALTEQGVGGEAKAAKLALDSLLKKHGLTIEDLRNEKRTMRRFSIKNRDEIIIFNHCIINRFGLKSYVWNHHYALKRDYRHILADMTDIEYLDFKPFFEFHIRQYRKELKKMFETVQKAYIHKHDLFDNTSEHSQKAEGNSDVDMQELYRIMQVMDSMESTSYYKTLSE